MIARLQAVVNEGVLLAVSLLGFVSLGLAINSLGYWLQ